MLLDFVAAVNLIISIYCVYMIVSEGKAISYILDWIIDHETKEGKNNDETA